MKWRQHTFILTVLFLSALLSSCARPPQKAIEENSLAYLAYDEADLVRRFAPVYLVDNADVGYNRIGTAVATLEEGRERVSINPEKATIYTSIRRFTTALDSYTNLIYRVHFQEIPFSIVPFYLGAGQNIGLFSVVTLNSRNEPVLYSLLHTCGCYLAFIPTSHLPEASWPNGWQRGRHDVYGENLPTFLNVEGQNEGKLLVVHMRPEVHRVKDVFLISGTDLQKLKTVVPEIEPFEALENLVLDTGEVTSFYETSGPRTGYVKGSQKVWERLLISWWAFDWRVGEDKILGRDKSDGIVFYTSLKPWARDTSDLRDFPGFLRYWGWNL